MSISQAKPIHRAITFLEKEKASTYLIQGELKFPVQYEIDNLVLMQSKVNIKNEVRIQVKELLLREVYGELIKVFPEFEARVFNYAHGCHTFDDRAQLEEIMLLISSPIQELKEQINLAARE